MELALSLGNRPGSVEINNINNNSNMGFCMGLGLSKSSNNSSSSEKLEKELPEKVGSATASPPRLQLDLLPLTPLPRHSQPPPPLRFPWLSDNVSPEPVSSDGPGSRTVDVNGQGLVGVTAADEAEEESSPNSGTSSFMEFSLYRGNNNNSNNNERENGENGNNYGQEMMMMMVAGGGTTSRGSDDDENGSTRKKLRLSKEQSAFLEESFKEHHTLNPKQKLALAKQLNLRPRQVEVWFQNRRARTKLKQTEVDCEYLKRCCETLTEENRRLQKELQELRALKASQPFFMHLPATTLTMCPSCERVAPTSASVSASASTSIAAKTAGSSPSPTTQVGPGSVTLSLGKTNSKLRTQTQIETIKEGSS